jgi:hypothetical protein
MGLRWIRALAVVPLAMHVGCGYMLKNVARDVTPAVVAGAVKGIADPETQRLLVSAVDEGRVKTVTGRLGAGMIDAMLDTLEDPARRGRLEAIVTGLTAKAAGTAVDSMLARALDDKMQARMRLALDRKSTRLNSSHH